MGDVIQMRPPIYSKAPESATIIELATLGSCRCRVGSILSSGFHIDSVFLTLEADGGLHLYQKGSGLQDHLFFWQTCIEGSAEDFPGVDQIIQSITTGEWVADNI